MFERIRSLFRRKTILILSIDGGGIRGLIAARVLHELEDRLKQQGCHTPLGDLFDLIAGSSTGALISLGIGMPNQRTRSPLMGQAFDPEHKPITVARICNIYRRLGSTIFPPDRFFSLRTVRQAFAEKYNSAPLERILLSMYGDYSLQDCRTNILITAYDTVRRSPHFFKNRLDRPGEDPNFYLRDVARATTAAPTFFKPALIRELCPSTTGNPPEYCLIDGAMICNNPALAAYIEARKIFPWAKHYTVVSIGSGQLQGAYPYDEIQGWGYVDWVSPVRNIPLFTLTNDAQTSLADYQLTKLPGLDYFRINLPLDPSVSEDMDDSSPKNIRAIDQFSNKVISVHEPALQRIEKLLLKKAR